MHVDEPLTDCSRRAPGVLHETRSPDHPATQAPLFRSRFGGLWIDRSDAHDVLADRLARGTVTPGEAEQLACYIDNGYVVLPGAADQEVIDEYLEFLRAFLGRCSGDDLRLPRGQGPSGLT